MTRFVVLVPSFNMDKYITRCLKSAMTQRYQGFKLIWVDDSSSDATGILGRRELFPWVDLPYRTSIPDQWARARVKHWTNAQRQGILANHVSMLSLCNDDEVAVCLDGDDQLSGPDVLEYLAEVYQDPAVWVTYGSYEYDLESRNPNGDSKGIGAQIPPDNHTRDAGWMATHLKTFRTALFRHVHQEDLKFRGEYIDPSGDVALMMPLIEMAGPAHARFIDRTLYWYCATNPLADAKTKPSGQRAMMAEIMSRERYKPLPDNVGRGVGRT